jgi:pSer/pThr/pTyr-binding forkhead associated (FHA) protein
MQAVLVMFRADGERRSFSLPRTITVLGRREDCDLRIPLGEVSRKHCRFIIDTDSGELRLEDLGSSNGTYHNGVRVQEAVIQPGDTVQVGPVVFVVQIDGVPADEDIQPALPSSDHDTSIAAVPVPDEEDDGPPALPAGDMDLDIVDLGLEEIEEPPPNR